MATLASLLCLAAAPTALATHSTEVRADSAVLGPGGSVEVGGTLACIEGYSYTVGVIVRQRSGQGYNVGTGSLYGQQGTCPATGPVSYSAGPLFGQGPFHAGPASVSSWASVCDSFSWFADCAHAQDARDMKITV